MKLNGSNGYKTKNLSLLIGFAPESGLEPETF